MSTVAVSKISSKPTLRHTATKFSGVLHEINWKFGSFDNLPKLAVKVGDKIKTIRFGQKGAKTAGKPKAGESARMKAKRKSFKARHAKNIAKGKMSAAYWADRVKW